MSEGARVAVIVGSLRAGAFSRKLARALIERQPPTLDCRLVEIADLPLYSEDLDPQPPAAWTRFREEVRATRGVLFVTPEYNRSIPGGLKNAVDVGSRPAGESVWNGLPTGVVSCTPYKLGGMAANLALRQCFVFLNMPVLQQPEAFIPGVGDLFDEEGAIATPETDRFLAGFMTQFAAWVTRLAPTR